MRDIKFRAWNSVLHEYRTLDMNSGKQNLGMGFEATGGIGSNTTTIYRSVGDVIEQYTGLKDFNGVEIYENDIVKIPLNEAAYSNNTVAVVSYDKNSMLLAGRLVLSRIYTVVEVVGNIHENADLLEEL